MSIKHDVCFGRKGEKKMSEFVKQDIEDLEKLGIYIIQEIERDLNIKERKYEEEMDILRRDRIREQEKVKKIQRILDGGI